MKWPRVTKAELKARACEDGKRQIDKLWAKYLGRKLYLDLPTLMDLKGISADDRLWAIRKGGLLPSRLRHLCEELTKLRYIRNLESKTYFDKGTMRIGRLVRDYEMQRAHDFDIFSVKRVFKIVEEC